MCSDDLLSIQIHSNLIASPAELRCLAGDGPHNNKTWINLFNLTVHPLLKLFFQTPYNLDSARWPKGQHRTRCGRQNAAFWWFWALCRGMIIGVKFHFLLYVATLVTFDFSCCVYILLDLYDISCSLQCVETLNILSSSIMQYVRANVCSIMLSLLLSTLLPKADAQILFMLCSVKTFIHSLHAGKWNQSCLGARKWFCDDNCMLSPPSNPGKCAKPFCCDCIYVVTCCVVFVSILGELWGAA